MKQMRPCGISVLLCMLLLSLRGVAQNSAGASTSGTAPSPTDKQKSSADKQINVSWIYGSYVPKDVPLESLSARRRFHLYIRQTYTTKGIYAKTTLFTLHDQIKDTNPQWGDGGEGFAKRLGTRQVQFIVQNTVTSLGNGLVGWEPRYERCRCDGFWPRTRHAAIRNFVTYARDEHSLRPQLMPYIGSFVGGATTAIWQPGKTNIYIAGYQGAVTQIFVGVGINWIAEFAPEISRILHLKK
jgi:hypothetical protein